MARLGGIDTQFFDDNGDPLSGGLLYFYDTGTTTPKTTYSDEDLVTPNTNPVVLDAVGVPGDIFFTGTAKIVLKDADDVQLRVMDPVDACCGTEGGGGAATAYWTFVLPAKTASFNAVAGEFYIINTSAASGDVTMTLPPSPATQDRVGYAVSSYNINRQVIIDGGTNNVLMGSLSAGTTSEPTLSEGWWGFSMIYDGTSWVSYDSLKVLVDV